MTRKIGFLLSMICCATMTMAQDLARIDTLLMQEMFATSQVGMMVWDLDKDSMVYAHNERQTMRPASTMKLLTAITALDELGEKHQFKTALYMTGMCDSTSLVGNIYCKGGMDPSFDMYDMDCMVEAIVGLRVDTIRGQLVADRSFKDEDLLGEGWCWDDKNPTLSPLLYKRKDSFLKTLREKLQERGITVLGSDSIGIVPQEAMLLIERKTPMANVLYKMLKESDNLYAEAMYYQMGKTAKSVQKKEKELMRRAGLDPGLYRLADGSGLSLYNYLSAEAEVKLLRYAYNRKKIFPALCQALPSSGVDGTLKSRMKENGCIDKVWAKTGTLTGISSLAGYLKAPDGHIYAFCIINQGVMSGSKAKAFQDEVCKALLTELVPHVDAVEGVDEIDAVLSDCHE